MNNLRRYTHPRRRRHPKAIVWRASDAPQMHDVDRSMNFEESAAPGLGAQRSGQMAGIIHRSDKRFLPWCSTQIPPDSVRASSSAMQTAFTGSPVDEKMVARSGLDSSKARRVQLAGRAQTNGALAPFLNSIVKSLATVFKSFREKSLRIPGIPDSVATHFTSSHTVLIPLTVSQLGSAKRRV
ncbi:hypothetical protein C8R45DRAFT_937515 [Mycena sanguinolenta]|nr:hypothetical protein C8R45DRAFT_937515 [Mycena sanguinolenta]